MEDKEFFERVLGLNGQWVVKELKLDLEKGQVRVGIEAVVERRQWKDKEGNKAHIQGYELRRWRHLDTMQLETILEVRVPRLLKGDGKTEMASVPWAESGSRWPLLFEAWCIRLLQMASDIEKARKFLGLSWDSVQVIMNRAVERGLMRRDLTGLEVVGVDEKSFGKGQDYISVLHDIEGGRVLEVGVGADAASVESLWKKLPAEALSAIKLAVMDMAETMRKGTRDALGDIDIGYDRFHVDKHVVAAVDEVRRKENQELLEIGDHTLKNTRFLWLFNPLNMKTWHRERFEKLLEMDLHTAHAWAMKELWARFWDMPDEASAKAHFQEWFDHIMKESLEPLKKVARMIKNHLDGILVAFRHKITNAVAEGNNSIIQSLKNAARGFRNFSNYRVRILFYCGKLDMLPNL